MRNSSPKIILWSLPLSALILTASLTYATSRPRYDRDSTEGKKQTKSLKVNVPHMKELETYLKSVSSYLTTPPRDGNFGVSRIPTLHGKAHNSIPGFKEVSDMGKEYSMVSYVVGKWPQRTLDAWKKAEQEGQRFIPAAYRLSMVHILNNAETRNDYNAIFKKVTEVKSLVDKEGYETYADSTKVGDRSAWVMTKAVIAPEKSCYKCHDTVKEGEPIGHIALVLFKKQP
jgi:hypothetical protein